MSHMLLIELDLFCTQIIPLICSTAQIWIEHLLQNLIWNLF